MRESEREREGERERERGRERERDSDEHETRSQKGQLQPLPAPAASCLDEASHRPQQTDFSSFPKFKLDDPSFKKMDTDCVVRLESTTEQHILLQCRILQGLKQTIRTIVTSPKAKTLYSNLPPFRK